MASWLQKILTPPAQTSRRTGVPTKTRESGLPADGLKPFVPPSQNLPNATIIYGIGASLMFVAAFFLLLSARWFPALGVFVIGMCLTGFALHLLKHQD